MEKKSLASRQMAAATAAVAAVAVNHIKTNVNCQLSLLVASRLHSATVGHLGSPFGSNLVSIK